MRRTLSESQIEVESLERRAMLSATPGAEQGDAEQSEIAAAGVVSGEAYIADDNSTLAPNEVGVLEGQIVHEGYVGRFDARDVYHFQMPRAGAVSIQLDGLQSDADIYLLNSFNLTEGKSTNWANESELIEADIEAGDYFVVIESYGIWSATDYRLTLTAALPELPPDAAGNEFDTANDLGTLPERYSLADYVGYGDQRDVFRFELDTAGELDVSLIGLEQDLDLHLYSSAREVLAASDQFGTSDESLSVNLEAGTYYVSVAPFAEASSEYVLTFARPDYEPTEPTDPEPAEPEPTEPEPTEPEPTEPEPTEPEPTEPEPTEPEPTEPEPTEPEPTEPEPTEPEPTEPEPTEPEAPQPLADVPYFGTSREWGVNYINAPEAWAAGYTGEGVTVAVIDTGVEVAHQDLAHSIWTNSGEVPGDGIDNDGNGFIDDVRGWDFVTDDNDPTGGHSHGSHVAGIVAAANNDVGSTGVAYAATIMPIRVLDDSGAGSTADVARGIRYAVDNGADIINLSLGGGNSSRIFAALRYADENGVLVVAASGNEGQTMPGYPARHSNAFSSVLSVGAYSSSGNVASFSNDVGGSGAVQVDAPGVGIYSALTNDRFGYQSGTSMAAPQVAGVAALVLSANPELTAVQLRHVLTQSANIEIGNSDAIGGVNAALAIPYGQSNVIVNADIAPTELPEGSEPASINSSRKMYTAAIAAMPESAAALDATSQLTVESPTSTVPSLSAGVLAAMVRQSHDAYYNELDQADTVEQLAESLSIGVAGETQGEKIDDAILDVASELDAVA